MTGLWSRDFLLGLTAYFFLFLSVSLFFLLPLFLKQLQSSGSQVGLIMGIHSLTAIAIRPFFGRVIDRRGAKKISLLGIAILILSVPFFHLVSKANALPVLLRAITGIGWGISMTATITMCTDLAPVQSMARSIGIVGVAGLIANAVGPSLGEEIIKRAGFGGLFNCSLIFLVLAFLLICLTRELPGEDREPGLSSPRPGLPVSASLVVLLIIGSMPVVHGSVRGAIIYFMPLLVRALDLGRVGPFFVIFSVAAILSRFRLGGLADRSGPKRVVLLSAIIIGLNLFLVWQVRSMASLWLTGFIGGFGQGLIFPALSTYLIDFLGRENKGLAISLYNSLFDAGMGLGSIFYGWISEMAGLQPMYLVAGIMLLSFTIIFKIKAPDIRRPAFTHKEGG